MKSSSKVLGQNMKSGGEVQSMVIGQALKTVISGGQCLTWGH